MVEASDERSVAIEHSPMAMEAMNGSSAVEAQRKDMKSFYGMLMAVYVLGGMLFYYVMEDWSVLESSVFILSILTGCGYGHLIPTSDLGLLVTSVYIFVGLVLFATFAGQILDLVMESEIDAVMEAVKAGGSDENVNTHYKQAQRLDKRRQFIVGSINLGALCISAVVLFHFAFGENLVDSIYFSAVAVLKLDSACLLDGVQCSHGRHAHSGGSAPWLFFAIFWYFLTYGIIGHFLFSASNYLGVDPETSVSQVKTLTRERLQRMDHDGDGHVSRSEFLADRLAADGLVDKGAIDAILENFDHLDKDKSGKLNKKDLGHA